MHRHDQVPVVFGHLEQQVVANDARVVDEDDGGAELRNDAGHGRVHLVCFGDIHTHAEAPAACRFDRRDRCCASGFVKVEDGDGIPVLGQSQGCSGTNAAGRTSDDGNALRHVG